MNFPFVIRHIRHFPYAILVHGKTKLPNVKCQMEIGK